MLLFQYNCVYTLVLSKFVCIAACRISDADATLISSSGLKRFRRDPRNTSAQVGVIKNDDKMEVYLLKISDLAVRNLTREMFKVCPVASICGERVVFHLDVPSTCCIVCSCERSCIYTDSCCPHYLEQRMDDIDTEPNEYVHLPMSECRRALFLKEKNVSKVFGSTTPQYKFISYCPKSASQIEKDLCRSDLVKGFKLEDVMPLYDASTVHNFMNRHCAQCNNVDMRNVIPWKIKLICGQDPLEATDLIQMEGEVFSRNDCYMEFLPPDESSLATLCDTEKITTCNNTGLWDVHDAFLEYACRVYPLTYVLNTVPKKRYSNIFCALCNGEQINTATQNICDMVNINTVYAFYVLVKLPKTEDGVKEELCREYTAFDPLYGQCREIYCTPPNIINIRSKTCVDIAASNVISGLEISARATFNHVLPAKTAVDQVLNYMEKKLDQKYLCDIEMYPKTSHKRNVYSAFEPGTYITEVMLVIHVKTEMYGNANEHYRSIAQQLRRPNTFKIGPFRTNVSMEVTIHGIDQLLQIPSLETKFINVLFPSNAIYWTDIAVSKMLKFYEDPYDNTLVASGIEIKKKHCSVWDVVYGLEFLPCIAFTYNIDNRNFKRTPSGLMFDDRIMFRFGEFISTNDTYVLICVDAVQQKLNGSTSYYMAYGDVIMSLMLGSLFFQVSRYTNN